jgi:hypothetical protein
LQVVINQGALVSVLASGLSARCKNSRDLMFQPFVGIMGTNLTSCFLLDRGVDKRGGSAGIWKFVRSLGAKADGFSQASFADKASCW